MTSWSAKRRFAYGGTTLLILVILISGIFWKVIYKTPTCFDGLKNGDEKGIDCGGACQRICTSDALSPVVLWSKIFNISGDIYTAVAFIENPNINSKNPKAAYQFKIYDEDGKLLTIISGETSIPKNKKFAVFETGISLKNGKPKSADFSFVSFSPWVKDTEKEPDINLTYSSLLKATTSPRITGTITNNSTVSLDQVELAVLVLDANENVVAASRSFVDNLYKKTAQDFVFTWPKAFNLGVEECASPVLVSLALDRSGSMKSESVSPPEPFNTVKNTAKDFIKNLGGDDQVSVVSFGDTGRIESDITPNKDLAVLAIDKLSLATTSEQTNIYDGLVNSINTLKNSGDSLKKVIILLTDGIPTVPIISGQSDYPVSSSLEFSKNIKADQNVVIYTIGLGKNINETYLKSLSSGDNYYFSAPNKGDLSNIYTKISSNLCTKKPNVITVIYRPI
jgi:hypothetical protein